MECIREKDTDYLRNISCVLKNSARGVKAMTIMSNLVQPLYYININIATLQKSSANIYNSVIFNISFEGCSVLESSPPLIKLVLPFFKAYAPHLIHSCPYEGRLGVEDIAIDFSKMPFFKIDSIPKGDYRVVIQRSSDCTNTKMLISITAFRTCTLMTRNGR